MKASSKYFNILAVFMIVASILLNVGQCAQPYHIILEKHSEGPSPNGSNFEVNAGESIDLDVVIRNVNGPPVAGSCLNLHYDPKIVQKVECISSIYKESQSAHLINASTFQFEGYDTFGKYTGDVVVAVLRLTTNASSPVGSSSVLSISGQRLGASLGTPVWGPSWQAIDTVFENATLKIINQKGKTWTVCPSGCDFSSIQKAINHADSGDTILVKNGEYHELLLVNKSLTIRGQNRNSTIINGDYLGDVINVTADGVVIEDLRVTRGYRYIGPKFIVAPFGIGIYGANNVTISKCRIDDCHNGIVTNVTKSASGLIMEGNEIEGNKWAGISLWNMSDTAAVSNNIHDNGMGIISDFPGKGINCSGNELVHNQYSGLCFLDGMPGATISNNRIEDNCYVDFYSEGDYSRAGGYFEYVENSIIRGNHFIHNGGEALVISGMSDSVVEGNIMENNYDGFSYADTNPSPNNTISLSNTVEGKPILYLEGAEDLDLIGSPYSTIYFVGGENISIRDAVMTIRNGFGITFRGTEKVVVKNNSVSNNAFQNILLTLAQDETISGNRVENAWYGIGVSNSQNITVSSNIAIGNHRGIAAHGICQDVLFSHNILENNSIAGLSFEYVKSVDGDAVNCIDNVIRGCKSEIPVKDLGLLLMQSMAVNVSKAKIDGLYEGAFIIGGEHNNLTASSIQNCRFGIEICPFPTGFETNLPSRYHRIFKNNVSVEQNAFFTDTDNKLVYGNHIFLNNFVSAQKPIAEVENEIPLEWTSGIGSPSKWGLPRLDVLAQPDNIMDIGGEENCFHTDTQLIYKYKGQLFAGYLGNYWNWYRGTDRCGNGVGTSPYKIQENNTDHYPLISPTSAYLFNFDYPLNGNLTANQVSVTPCSSSSLAMPISRPEYREI